MGKTNNINLGDWATWEATPWRMLGHCRCVFVCSLDKKCVACHQFDCIQKKIIGASVEDYLPPPLQVISKGPIQNSCNQLFMPLWFCVFSCHQKFIIGNSSHTRFWCHWLLHRFPKKFTSGHPKRLGKPPPVTFHALLSFPFFVHILEGISEPHKGGNRASDSKFKTRPYCHEIFGPQGNQHNFFLWATSS